mgnify:FL=1
MDFNPLHREGGDLLISGLPSADQISIHSTARVETMFDTSVPANTTDFNPLHREGGDWCAYEACRQHMEFQSTPPRGWRLMHRLINLGNLRISIHSTARVETWISPPPTPFTSNFNPLHREGGDFSAHSVRNMDSLFQSTPPRGWRRWAVGGTSSRDNISIHSTARVETLMPISMHGYHTDFNPLHREGGDGRPAAAYH